ncbi:MAG: CHAT domain-containing protein [Acidobacteriota bacterium]
MIKILFLAANPADTEPLPLDEEIRAIDKKIRAAQFRDLFDIKQHGAVSIDELQELLLRHNPDIVHFTGHGSEASEIILNDKQGNSKPVSVRALSNLFAALKDNIRCVVLSCCYSQLQARAIAQHIECVIGMSNDITAEAALSFASAFYQALAYGRTINTAFQLGCGQIDLEDLPEPAIPKLLTLTAQSGEIKFVDPVSLINSSTTTKVSNLSRTYTNTGETESIDLMKKLNALVPQQFNQLLYVIKPPDGLISSSPAPQAERTYQLLTWAESPTGCGLATIKRVLAEILISK